MICPKCRTTNDDNYVFCVNCGASVTQAGNVEAETIWRAPNSQNLMPPTVQPQNFTPPPTANAESFQSIETSFLPAGQYGGSIHNFIPTPPVEHSSGANKKWFILAGALLVLLLAAGAGAFYFLSKKSVTAEVLPDHLGMFVQSVEKDKVDEIKKQDFVSGLEAKDKLLKDESLPVLESSPNLILYSETKDVPLSDLRLIRLDTIKPDGSLKQLDFQAAPVDGKPEMKRLRVPEGLAVGKYAFAILDGFLTEGKHKFWAFQVKNSDKANNDAALKDASVAVKSKQTTKTETQPTNSNTAAPPSNTSTPPPSGAKYAYSTSDRLILRDAPSLSGNDSGVRLRKGERVDIIRYSDNYDSWRGRYGNWAYVETEGGYSGWVFTPLLRY